MKSRFALVLLLIIAVVGEGELRAAQEDSSFGQSLKKFFAGPTPTPRKKKKKSTSAKKKPSPKPTGTASPSPSASPIPSPVPTASVPGAPAPSPQMSMSALPTTTPAPSAAATARTTPSPAGSPNETPATEAASSPTPLRSPRSRAHAPIIEPVRPIEPGPRSRRRRVETPPPGVSIPSPTAVEQRPTPLEKIPPQGPPSSPPPPTPGRSSSASASAPAAPTPSLSPSAAEAKRKPTAPASISPNEVSGYEKYSPSVRKVLDLSLELTTQNLGYKYGSADPRNGGMDCSGFIHYVLGRSGFGEVPRDAREQYIWVRKAGLFQAVLGHRDDSFELDALKPGDLLFWSGTYAVDRDPAITHTMIYLGREKGTNQRLMVGASDGRTYKGQQKFGVSVFDFKVTRPKSDDRSGPMFVGYARIPALKEQ
jgi:cell wall-associated NlpC family hydrolase